MVQRFGKLLILLGMIAFVLGGSFGMSHVGMSMQPDGKMLGCPFMGNKMAICNMSPLEHAALLQGMFTATIPQPTILTLLALLIASTVTTLIVFAFPRDGDGSAQRVSFAHRESRGVDPLRLAFASGIIHSKVF